MLTTFSLYETTAEVIYYNGHKNCDGYTLYIYTNNRRDDETRMVRYARVS